MKIDMNEEEYAALEKTGRISKIIDGGVHQIELLPGSVHYAKCTRLGHFVSFVRAPHNAGTRRKSSFSVGEVSYHHRHKEKFCFFCGRSEDELGMKEVLTVDHIQRIDEEGDDIIQNSQILCSACHKLKDWAHTYITRHLVRGIIGKDAGALLINSMKKATL